MHYVARHRWLIRLALMVVIAGLTGCESLSQTKNGNTASTPPKLENGSKQETNKMSVTYINALRQHDREVLTRAGQASPTLPADINAAIADMDAESRELAVELVALQDAQTAGKFLLDRTADNDANVALLAVDKASAVIHKPETAEILEAIPERKSPVVRGKLYLEAGKRQEGYVLEELRKLAPAENDSEAKLQALAARAKRGGDRERQEFFDIVRKTREDDALQIQDLLLYIGDRGLAKGLIPWLENNEPVMRIGGDRQNMMARMCDVAVWTAHLLGVGFPFETTSLRNFSPQEIEAARKTLELLG